MQKTTSARETWCSMLPEPLPHTAWAWLTLLLPWKGGAAPQLVFCVLQLCIINAFALERLALGIGPFVVVSIELESA